MSVAIITGASRGLGQALAEDLVGAGWDVVIDGRDGDALRAAADAMGPRATAVPGDVRDGSHRLALVRAAEALGGLHLLVNNASTLGPSPLPRLGDVDLDDVADVYAVNVVGPLGLVQLGLPLLRASRGAIVNVTSDAAVEAYEGWGAYGSSKAALDQVGNVLAVEEGDVRVWSFDPGDMRTEMHQAAFPGEDISDRPEPREVVPAFRRLLSERPPSGRVRAADLLSAVSP